MSTATPRQVITVDEFLALPDNGIKRDLIHGVVVERGQAGMMRRSREHSKVMARLSCRLQNRADCRSSTDGVFHNDQQLTGDDVLPEFNVTVSELLA